MIEKIAITGASGFIGSHLVARILEEKHLKLVSLGRSKPLPLTLNKCFIKQVFFDLNDLTTDLYEKADYPDLLIHLAWENLADYNSLFHLEKALSQHYKFLKSMIVAGLPKLLVVGTCFEYGLKEGLISEESQIKPLTAYALAKDKLHRKLNDLAKRYSYNLIWGRLFYVHGLGQSKRALLPLIEAAVKNGLTELDLAPADIKRDYLEVEKVADIIFKLACQSQVLGAVNICSGEAISLKELVEAKLKNLKAVLKINYGFQNMKPYEPLAFWGDNSKLEQALASYKILNKC